MNPADFDFARDANGDVMERVVEVPYRPEFIHLFEPNGVQPCEVPWRDRPLVEMGAPLEVLIGDTKAEAWPTGELREGAEFPAPLLSHMWAIDERICQRHGFSMLHVARVELPALDYARADTLTMRVHVRVLSKEAFAVHANTCPLGCGVDYAPGRCAEGDRLADLA